LGATQDEYLRLQSINLAISVEDINYMKKLRLPGSNF